jgi:hypothetical protein
VFGIAVVVLLSVFAKCFFFFFFSPCVCGVVVSLMCCDLVLITA